MKHLNTLKNYFISIGGLMTLIVTLAGMLRIVATVLLAMMLSDTAFAQSAVTINPTQGPAGTFVTGTGTNWQPGDQMHISWDSGEVLANTLGSVDITYLTAAK